MSPVDAPAIIRVIEQPRVGEASATDRAITVIVDEFAPDTTDQDAASPLDALFGEDKTSAERPGGSL